MHSWQNQLPFGIATKGGSRQNMWKPIIRISACPKSGYQPVYFTHLHHSRRKVASPYHDHSSCTARMTWTTDQMPLYDVVMMLNAPRLCAPEQRVVRGECSK